MTVADKKFNNRRVLRKVVESNFSFADVDSKFVGKDALSGNVYCPFHENYHTPAARFYWEDERDILILYCYKERRRYTSYDYVNLIMCESMQKYPSVEYFCRQKLGNSNFEEQYKVVSQNVHVLSQQQITAKINYIDEVYSNTGNTIDYIERLYDGEETNSRTKRI